MLRMSGRVLTNKNDDKTNNPHFGSLNRKASVNMDKVKDKNKIKHHPLILFDLNIKC